MIQRIANYFAALLTIVTLSAIGYVSYLDGFVHEAFLWWLGGASITAALVLHNLRQRSPQKVLWLIRTLGLLPRLSESQLFVVALSFLFLLIFTDFYNEHNPLLIFILNYWWFPGLLLALLHGFIRKQKSALEIWILRIFIASSFAVIAGSLALYTLQNESLWYLPLVIWNGFQAYSLMFLSGDTRSVGAYIDIPKDEITKNGLIAAVLVVVIVMFVGLTLYSLYWAVAVSTTLIIWSIIEQFAVRFGYWQK